MEWPNASTAALIIIIVLLCLFTARYFFYGSSTVPLPSYKSGFTVTNEGFVIPTGVTPKKEGLEDYEQIEKAPNCLNKNPTATSLLDMFPASSHNSDDYSELKHLLNKLSCFKVDIVSPKHVVNLTRKQPYLTSHDIEPIAEVTSRCFAKTISPRDLEISFDTWTARGNLLIEKIAATCNLSSADLTKTQSVFNLFIRDVRSNAQTECFQKEPLIAGKPGPRDPHPYSNPTDVEFGTYTGFY